MGDNDNIKVVVKVRPLIAREIEAKSSYQWRVNNNTITQIDNTYCHPFTFDKVYDKDTKTADVYDDIAKPIVEAALAGFNGTIFAYGQTSSGKTYTMTGTDNAPGIIPLAVLNIFDRIKDIPDREFLVRVSYVEIYNEKLIDLLDEKKNIKIETTLDGGVKVGATERLTTSPEEVLQVMEQGKVNRQTGFTNMNEESSRSHSIFQITIESREHIEGGQASSVNVSQLNLVDLAGSERSGQTGATGKRFKEGTHINKSLSALALVIKQLSENQRSSENQHVNYRDSKLTRILQNSLGGNAKTSIICAVTPAAVDETISTLQFASRAKAIKNTPAVNTVATDVTMIQNLTKELSQLKTQLEGKKNVEQDNHNLQNKIARLQSLFLNGFVQRSNTDILAGTRRKLNPPRRNTISTLHPIEENDLPILPRKPKFCTPSLKYNPATVNASEFKPIQKTASLSCVDEEPRLVTPPPTERRVNFNNEVIEIDSDDDNSTTTLVCSPYHKCRDETKTPPCILKKNAKLAEKNLKDIIELTEREKIFSPNVTELMESLEKKSTTIAKLEDDVIKLSKITSEKDVELEKLRSNIEKVEKDISSVTSDKEHSEKLNKEYETKLTDSEVTIDVLKNKAKMREEELLSLLRDHSSKKTFETAGINTSFVYADNEKTEQKESLLTDLQTQLKLKEETVIELHERISQQTNTISDLETSNKKFEELLSTHKNNITLLESEKNCQKSELEKLNAIIEDQKDLIDSINKQVESNCNIIEELQMKLNEKDNTLKEFIVGVDIDGTLSSEEIIIANNDNLKNIIHSLRMNIQNKREEFRNATESSISGNCNNILEELENSKVQIKTLTEELETSKSRFNENGCDMTKITEESNNLQIMVSNLNNKLSKLQDEKRELQNENDAYRNEVLKLKDCNDLLKVNIVGREHDSEFMKRKNEEISKKLFALECDIKEKNKEIICLEKQHINTQTHVDDIKILLEKVGRITMLLSGNEKDLPIVIDDLVIACKIFNESLDNLELAVLDIIKQKDDMSTLIEKQELEIDRYQSILNENNKSIKDFTCECMAMLEINLCSDNENQTQPPESNNKINDGCDYLKSNLQNLIESIKTTKSHLTEELEAKRIEINKLLCFDTSKESELNDVKSQISNLEEDVRNRDKLLNNVLNMCSDLTTELAIENNISCEFNTDTENTFEKIILTIEKISNYVTILKANNIDESDNTKKAISSAKAEILRLTEENLQLRNNIDILEHVKIDLSTKLKEVIKKNELFIINLRKSKELLDSLKRDVQYSLQEFKYGFSNLNDIFKEHNISKIIKDEHLDLSEFSKTENQNVFVELKLDTTENNNSKYSNVDIISRDTLHSPPSLLTICCNTIVEAIDLDNKEKSPGSISSTSSTDLENVCQCDQLLLEIQSLRKDNEHLKNKINSLHSENEDLIKEQEIVQKEVRSLIDSSHELQKRLVNHRTHLSTLMATTYAENKSLTSQIKCLQHYYSRFYSGCQKDIPCFKKQLQDLLVLLKTESLSRHNDSFKRYSLPDTLDNTLIQTTFKNESMLDGDLLMLDTNVSLATTCDNTLLGPDQTGLEITQINYCKEVGCQTYMLDDSLSCLHPQVETDASQKIVDSLEELREENDKLRKLVDEYSNSKQSKSYLVNSTCSPLKNQCEDFSECKHVEELIVLKREFSEKYQILSDKLTDMESQKLDVEKKFDKLNLEVPNVDALTRKLNAFEKELHNKQNNIDTLKGSLSQMKKEMEKLQEENDDLSNQVMDYVSEIDSLKAEHEILNNEKTDLIKKLEKDVEFKQPSDISNDVCLECKVKDQTIDELRDKLASDTYSRVNRSYSDSESSSRYNKLCTLQSELHAGKEDCMELKESVATIKNHLDGSPNHQPMDMDISMEQPLFSLNEELADKNNKGDLPDPLDIYNVERINCYNYYIEKTDDVNSVPDSDKKIVDVMRMLYESLILKHSNEIQNLKNCLKDFEEEKQHLEKQVSSLKLENDKVLNDYDERNQYLQTMAEVVLCLKNNLTSMEDISVPSEIIAYFRDNFLAKVDSEFGLQGATVFEKLISSLQDDQSHRIQEKEVHNQSLQEELISIKKELSSVNENVSVLKSALTDKENECNLLCQKKEKIDEITNAVTLDIIKKDRDLRDAVKIIYKKVSDMNIPHVKELDFSLPLHDIIKMLFEYTFDHFSRVGSPDQINQIIALNEALSKSKELLNEKERDLESHKEQNAAIKAENERNSVTILDLQQKVQEYVTLNSNLKETHELQIQENSANLVIIEKLTCEINMLKEDISNKEIKIKDLESKIISKDKQNNVENETKLREAIRTIEEANNKIEELKTINERIIIEKNSLDTELEEAKKTIAHYKLDLEKLSNDILVLKESVKENSPNVEKLNSELKSLQLEKTDLYNKLQEKTKECTQLQVNIKTHEKTAEIQSKMIIKTRKQKEDAELESREKDHKLEEMVGKCKLIQEECNRLTKDMKVAKDDISSLNATKDLLEARVSELETELEQKREMSVTRRRRQSIQDSRRHDVEDERKLEAMFKPHTPTEDMFMDVDQCGSNRSTPRRQSRGRDSISSRHEQSEEEHSAHATLGARSRRRSMHDRSRLLPTDNLQNNSNSSSANTSMNGDVHSLRTRLAACEAELADLQERHRELDEECETCASYLRESEQRCARLKHDKTQLESKIEELNKKLSNASPAEKPIMNDAHVNTDEDWSNLHTVVVDRMSYDAEVEKNKKLMKTIEELRFSKQHLKNTMGKMQKALDKHSTKDKSELEATRAELESCRQQLTEYRDRCRELDEECETCAEYLRERDEQCRKLREAKAALESKLEKYVDASPLAQSVRKKRHSLHDRCRGEAPRDASTDTSDMSQEKESGSQDSTSDAQRKDYDRLKALVQRLSAQKAELELQLQAFSSSPIFVATGSAIVQNQQITDVLKENQKLKKMNAKLITMCKKRGKTAESNRENEDPSDIVG